MCMKSNAIKRLYLIMNFPTHSKPQILGVVKQYPLYRQIFEDTKHHELNSVQLQRLGIQYKLQGQTRLFELEIPVEKLV